MKYVVFSFDDGRKDFYTNALPILRKYNLLATVNVISDFIGKQAPQGFLSSNNEFMTLDEIQESYKYGIEIGNHSKNHTNDLNSIKSFTVKDTIIDGEGYGFASPGSYVYKKNFEKYTELLNNKNIIYIRSGRQVKRDGYFHAALYIICKKIKSPLLFWIYQKRNLINIRKEYLFYPSVAIDAFSSVFQIRYVIKKMKDDEAVIFMFHSILKKSAKGYGKDKWFNDIEEFEELCRFCASNSDVKVVTNKKLHELINKERR